MKKISFLLIASFICVGVLFTACGDNNENGGTTPPEPGYSTLTPEQQKEKLQNEGIAFLNEVDGLKDLKAIKILVEFSRLMGSESESTTYYQTMGLRADDDLLHIADFYGIFTWNEQTGEWTRTDSKTAAEWHFKVDGIPAKIVATAVSSGVTGSFTDQYYNNYWDEEEQVWIYEVTEETTSFEIPKEVNVKLYSNTTEVGSVSVKADVKDANTAPKLTELTYTLDNYTHSTKFAKGTPNIATSTLKKGNKVLIDAKIDVSGNLDDLVNAEDENDISYPETGNATIKILDNLSFVGKVEIAKYVEAGKKASQEFSKNEAKYGYEKAREMALIAEVAAMNAYWHLYLVSLSDNTKIADLIYKAEWGTETTENEWGTDTYSYYNVIPVLKFNDNTQVEAAVYFSEGFDTFLDKLEKFVKNLGIEE
jgi:hypothetical protein